MKVIFNADDLGVAHGINEGIVQAYQQGLLTSTSIRTNGEYFQEAIKLLRKDLTGIGVGLHVNLTDGITLNDNFSSKKGEYKYSYLSYLLNNPVPREKIFQEIEEQLLLCKKNDIKIDHLDSEEHIHMLPEVFREVCKLGKKYNIKSIRLCNEPLYFVSYEHLYKQLKNFSQIKWGLLKSLALIDKKMLSEEKIFTTDAYYGILYTNQMDEKCILSILTHALKQKYDLIEIALHPALPEKNSPPYTSKKFEKYAALSNRRDELKALTSQKIRQFIKDNKIKLTTFKVLER